jgi:hypothetical protein
MIIGKGNRIILERNPSPCSTVPGFWFENVFPAYFGTEISQENFLMVFREFMEYVF